MIRILLTLGILFCSQLLFAQVRATTESGNKVILFDNGTWKYEEKKIDTPAQEAKPADKSTAVVVAATVPSAKVVEVDTSREIQTDFGVVYNATSKRLDRFFGEENSKTRCKASCSNQKGDVKVHFLWEFPVGDGNRYYGYLKEGSLITLHFANGQKLELYSADGASWKTQEKYNFSALKGFTQNLNPDQIQILSTQALEKIEVEWKKDAEIYEVDDTNFFIQSLAKVL